MHGRVMSEQLFRDPKQRGLDPRSRILFDAKTEARSVASLHRTIAHRAACT